MHSIGVHWLSSYVRKSYLSETSNVSQGACAEAYIFILKILDVLIGLILLLLKMYFFLSSASEWEYFLTIYDFLVHQLLFFLFLLHFIL